MAKPLSVRGFRLQENPGIVVAAIPGKWLLAHSTPSWRIEDPKKGFQRVVREERAREIAIAVLDQGRSFPNAIVLATNRTDLDLSGNTLVVPPQIRFLVVDGQHRLWAQHFAAFEGMYACLIHLGLTEVEMARLFLEINDNQRRVPSSLRWDLVRLVRPDDDPSAIEAAELVFELATDKASPLFQRIDLTGEQGEIELKQGSIAPELKTLVTTKRGALRELPFDRQFETLVRFLAAARSVDSEGWRSGKSVLMKARVLRALFRIIPDIAAKERKPADAIPTATYAAFLTKIKRSTLAPARIRAIQGSAGIKEIYELIKSQIGLA